MSLVVQTVARLLAAFILLFGIHVVLHGHLTPGGGFSGGVIVACAFILLTLAGGRELARRTAAPDAAPLLDSAGALLFLGLALGGLFLCRDAAFFRNFIATAETSWFRLWSSGVILLSNIGIGLKVGMSLLLVFTVLAAMRPASRGGRDPGDRGGGRES